MAQVTLTITTRGQGLYEITRNIAEWLRDQSIMQGALTVFIRHTSASLLIQENADPAVQDDLRAFFHRLVPPSDAASMSYLTHVQEGPDDMPAHIKAAMMPVSLTIPVQNGRLALGRWQGIYVFEHRDAPHRRDILCHLA